MKGLPLILKYINMNFIKVIISFLGVGLLSCVPNQKIIYMQNLEAKSAISKSGELIPYDVEEYRLQCNDVVDISVKTTSAELNAILKVDESDTQIRNMSGLNSGDAFFLNGYVLDADGIVELPLVGEIKLVGMSVKEAKLAIEEKLKKYVTQDNYYVRVRLGGIRYSALGEFNRPGKFTILQNRVTIYEAIANAGDMTTVANRKEVVVVRQYPDGVKSHTLNLLSDKIMMSEFFFIRPNDMIYVQPMKVKQWGTGVTVSQSLQLALSVLTVVLLFINVSK
jgi:polysaccharide biosynthesis/export protein